jgi:carbon storage regulator CsrA
MLVLTRRSGERIRIGPQMFVEPAVKGSRVRLLFLRTDGYRIDRRSVHETRSIRDMDSTDRESLAGRLVLNCSVGDSVFIDGGEIELRVLRVKRTSCSIGIQAPADCRIIREEFLTDEERYNPGDQRSGPGQVPVA